MSAIEISSVSSYNETNPSLGAVFLAGGSIEWHTILRYFDQFAQMRYEEFYIPNITSGQGEKLEDGIKKVETAPVKYQRTAYYIYSIEGQSLWERVSFLQTFSLHSNELRDIRSKVYVVFEDKLSTSYASGSDILHLTSSLDEAIDFAREYANFKEYSQESYIEEGINWVGLYEKNTEGNESIDEDIEKFPFRCYDYEDNSSAPGAPIACVTVQLLWYFGRFNPTDSAGPIAFLNLEEVPNIFKSYVGVKKLC